MKTAAVAIFIAMTASFSATTDAHHHHHRDYNSTDMIAGAVIGTAIGTLLTNAFQPRITYVYQQPVYQQPISPVVAPVVPYYLSQPRACQTVRVPVYNQGGRLVEYVQLCAN